MVLSLVVAAVLEAAIAEVEAPHPWASAAVAVAAAVALLLRRRRPVLTLGVVVALAVVAQVPGMGLSLSAALVLACLVALASVGRHSPDPVSLAAVTATTGIFVLGAAFVLRPWDVVVAMLGCSAAWGAGRALRREAVRGQRLERLAADLAAAREREAVEAVRTERLRMARELHDAVAHSVSILTLQAGGVRRRLEGDPARRQERDVLLGIEQLGREAVDELHRVVTVLRTQDRPDGGAGTAAPLDPTPSLDDLELLAARFRDTGLSVEIDRAGLRRALPRGLELAAYRVAQEALTNVLKHARGSSARVALEYERSRLRLRVHDDGPALTAFEPGHGLRGMRERVSVYDGTLDAGPVHPRGFAVEATFSIPDVTT